LLQDTSQTRDGYALIAENALKIILAQTTGSVPNIKLDLISKISTKKSSHVTVVISGFMSEDVDMKNHWKGIVMHLQGTS
jgi:hypothetical protein